MYHQVMETYALSPIQHNWVLQPYYHFPNDHTAIKQIAYMLPMSETVISWLDVVGKDIIHISYCHKNTTSFISLAAVSRKQLPRVQWQHSCSSGHRICRQHPQRHQGMSSIFDGNGDSVGAPPTKRSHRYGWRLRAVWTKSSSASRL